MTDYSILINDSLMAVESIEPSALSPVDSSITLLVLGTLGGGLALVLGLYKVVEKLNYEKIEG